jgi:hypothetical protein
MQGLDYVVIVASGFDLLLQNMSTPVCHTTVVDQLRRYRDIVHEARREQGIDLSVAGVDALEQWRDSLRHIAPVMWEC